MITEELLELFGLTQEEYEELGIVEKMFLNVSEKLATIDQFEWIDLEAGQMEMPLESYPIPFPCALIDFPAIDFQDETHRNQQGIMNVQVRIGIDLYEDLHMADGTAAPDRAAAIKRINLITKIHKLLQGYEEDFFTPFTRVGLQSEKRDDGIKVFTLTYATAAKDDSAAEVVEGKETTFHFNKITN